MISAHAIGVLNCLGVGILLTLVLRLRCCLGEIGTVGVGGGFLVDIRRVAVDGNRLGWGQWLVPRSMRRVWPPPLAWSVLVFTGLHWSSETEARG